MNGTRGLPGRAALVTGASRGIGKVIALNLARAGFAVGVNFCASRSEADCLVEQIRAGGGNAVALQADMANRDEVAGLVERTESAIGHLAVLVNNAGITRDKLTLQLTEDDWEATWLTNLVGPRDLAQSAFVAMQSRRCGRIINISSVVGVTGNAGQSNYAAAKSAMFEMTQKLAVRAAPFGITVNCVAPGYVATDATAHLTADQKNDWMARIPMGHFGCSDDIAHLVRFLSGPESAYLTGQCIAVDGGYCAAAELGFAL